jgi:hypothetical protein
MCLRQLVCKNVRNFVGIAKKFFYQVQYLFFTIDRTWYKGLAKDN